MSRRTLVLAAALCALAGAAQAADRPDPRRALHILRYVTKDYPKAVAKHEKDELEEQVEFLEAALAAVKALPKKDGSGLVEQWIGETIAMARQGRPAWEVNVKIAETAGAISVLYPAPLVEPPTHSLEQGKALYVKSCASCHGANGHAETPIARAMKQKPARLAGHGVKLKVTEVHDAITFGITGTPMPSYADVLSVQDRWDIAFYVLSLRK